MLRALIEKLLCSGNLTEQEAYQLIKMIMDEKLSALQIATVLTAMRMKGETAQEISGFIKGMKEKAIRINKGDEKILDVCGTGGDNSNSYNISTLTAFVLAAAGIKVVKHGNRGISSKCGSADIIKALNIKIELTPNEIYKSLQETNFAFVYAPAFHPAMKVVAPIRQELAIKTIFNILGPLANPADPDYQLIGVYDENKAKKIAEYFLLQNKNAFIIHSKNGWDEATPICPFLLIEVDKNKINEKIIHPEKLGFKKCTENELKGGSIEQHLKAALKALSGENSPLKDTIILNSALALFLMKKITNLSDGIEMAKSIIDKKLALLVIEKLRKLFPLIN